MRSTEILQDEHRVIEQVLNCLEKMADQALVAGRLDESSAREALDFFQTFADGCHHHKEEDHLFPLMEARWHAKNGYACCGCPRVGLAFTVIHRTAPHRTTLVVSAHPFDCISERVEYRKDALTIPIAICYA